MVAAAVSGIPNGTFGQSKFMLFDALLHDGKPNLRRLGLQPLPSVEHIWRSETSHADVEEDAIQRALRQLPLETGAYFIDIENWPLVNTTPAVRQDSIGKLLRVAEIVRKAMPTTKFGFYGFPPVDSYWPMVDPQKFPDQRAEWLEANRELEPLAQLVDYLFPSLYTAFDDRPGWLRYADETIKAARRYGKPVCPFLWADYHDSNKLLRDHELQADAWTEELRFCHAHADGIVFWGGYFFGGGRRRGWSESAGWWQAVRREFDLRG